MPGKEDLLPRAELRPGVPATPQVFRAAIGGRTLEVSDLPRGRADPDSLRDSGAARSRRP
eukprot:14666063-Alexandrium_andersonii.AAC.1